MPASLLGPASASYAKKRASTRPYNEFCQELRPLLPARLRNAEREKLLGVAWKALSNEERNKFNAAGTPMPPPSQRGRGGRHGGTRVACDHAPARPLELQLTAPPAPPHQLAAPLAPQLQLAVLSRAPELQSAEFMLAAPPAPQLQLTSLAAPPAAPHLQLAAPPAPPHQFDFDAVLSRAPELQLTAPSAPQLQLPALAAPPPPRAPQLLTAAATHRTLVENFLGADQQHQQQLARVAEMMDLAEIMEQQMTGEDAMEIALSLDVPRSSGTVRGL
eukprot:scaffold16805_cov59-Phaeocystis_antarctica.AAC.1